jgi:uncharacterized alkaline shock family protein YloU
MRAIEARELTEKCIVSNEEQLYKTVISKIIVKCAEGASGLVIPSSELTDKTRKTLTNDGYYLTQTNSFNPAQLTFIEW